MDNILVFGATRAEHNRCLAAVLKKLNKAKCHFGKVEIRYFGHIIGAGSFRPDGERVKAISEVPSPSNVSELKQFLRVFNYMGKYLPILSSELHPITSLLRVELRKKHLRE